MCSKCGREACGCLYDALASRDAELATLRARLEAAEREQDEARITEGKLRAALTINRATIERRTAARDAALFEVARLTRQRDEAREWAHSFAERAAKERDEALLQHALESGRRVAAEAERDEARGKALEEAARAINNWPHVAGMVRALAAKGGA